MRQHREDACNNNNVDTRTSYLLATCNRENMKGDRKTPSRSEFETTSVSLACTAESQPASSNL